MKHPLHNLAELTTRARIRAAVDSNCVPSIDPEAHAFPSLPTTYMQEPSSLRR